MASSKTAWGIEIGQFEIKAIQLEATADGVRVRDFWWKPHRAVLTDPALSQPADDSSGLGLGERRADQRTALENTLTQLAAQKRLDGSPVVISFSWMQNRGFARFTKLPFVEGENSAQAQGLVRYEAEQQIPFPLEDVEWDFHSCSTQDAPELDVGIFAVQREPLEDFLTLVSDKLGIAPAAVTLSPVALYNAVAYDRQLQERNDSLIVIDVGTSATDLIVADGSRCWMRTFPFGGHDYTEAILAKVLAAPPDHWIRGLVDSYAAADQFKIGKLRWDSDGKRDESMEEKILSFIISASKDRTDEFVGDLEKSIAFYMQNNRGSVLKRAVMFGSTPKLGLRGFVKKRLNLDVERVESFQRLSVEGLDDVATKANGAKAESGSGADGDGEKLRSVDFSEHTRNFGVAYGLALQGLGLAPIEVNLLPVDRMRRQVWQKKQRWFAAAAGVAVAAGGLMFVRGMLDNSAIADVSAKAAADDQVRNAKRFQDDLQGVSNVVGARSKSMLALLDDREVWPFIVHDAMQAVASGNNMSTQDANDVVRLQAADPARRQTYLRDLTGTYKFAGGKRVIEVTLDVEANAGDSPAEHFATTVGKWLQDNAKRDGVPYSIGNVKWTYTKMKVGENGSLEADASASTSTTNTATNDAAAGVEGGNFSAPGGSFTAGDGSAGNNFGGLSGKRTAGQGGTLNRPGGRLGGTGMGGGFNAPGGDEAAAQSGDSKFSRGKADTDAAPPADLEKLAPIPGRPALYPSGSTVNVGKITFEVVLRGEVAAAAPAEAPVEGQ